PKVVIFVTAYDEFALRAFEVHAIDYLLKPYSDSRFFKALDRAKLQLKSERAVSGNSALLQSIADQKPLDGELIEKTSDARLVVKNKGKIHLLLYDDIRWLEAYDYYVKIHLADSFHLIRESLKRLEQKLQPHGFIRIHKSSLVNIKYASGVSQLSPKEYVLNLKQGEKLKVSRNYRKALFDHLNLT
ncbi:MAG: LytTR family DNA-binding domain-containing protein, partial [Bacteroidota bacterium]